MVSRLFFVDENDLALGKALAQENPNVLYPGHPNLPQIPRGTPDDAWLQTAGKLGLVVLTRDMRIRYRPVEKAAWLKFGVRGFILTGKDSQSTQRSQAILSANWHTIEEIISQRPYGPWMYSVTASAIREINLVALPQTSA